MRWVIFLSMFFLLTCHGEAAQHETPITQEQIDLLKIKQKKEGQVTAEPGPGEGCLTLSEQIQFLEGELIKQNRINLDNAHQTNGLNIKQPSNELDLKQLENDKNQKLTNSLPINQIEKTDKQSMELSQHPQTSPQQFSPPTPQQTAYTTSEADKIRLAGLEARVALLEKQINENSQKQGTTATSVIGGSYG